MFRPFLAWLLNVLSAAAGRLLATRFEAAVLAERFEVLAQLEEQARGLEENGQTELAAQLRQQAAGILAAQPGGPPSLETGFADQRNGVSQSSLPPAKPRGRPPKVTIEPEERSMT